MVIHLRDLSFSSIYASVHNRIMAGVAFDVFDVFKYVCMSDLLLLAK